MPAEGEPRLLWDGRSPPLGAFTRPQHRDEARVRLTEGDRLLLYTDGLVERRDRALDEGFDLLRETVAGSADAPLEEMVQEITRTLLRDESTRDDVCVLLLAWNGSAFERHVGADLGTLSATRHALGRWLSSQGADHATRMDVVLAVSEALANAAEHGLRGDPTEAVRLRAVVDRRADGRDDVVVTVHDPGRWRTPDPLSDRGRGLRIIEALVDDMLVRHEQGTTVVLRSGLRKGPS